VEERRGSQIRSQSTVAGERGRSTCLLCLTPRLEDITREVVLSSPI
jgi:hypothetical protein